MTQVMAETVITPEDLAVRWGYHYRTILNHIRDGNIPAFKIRGQWRVKLEWVLQKEREGINL